MHAASVHPEPGSNSRMLVSTEFTKELNKSISELQFSSILKEWIVLLFLKRNCRDSGEQFSVLFLSYNWLLFNFQGSSAVRKRRIVFPVSRQLVYYTTVSFSCQEVFQIFLNFFVELNVSDPLNLWLFYYTTSFLFCQPFFTKNWKMRLTVPIKRISS